MRHVLSAVLLVAAACGPEPQATQPTTPSLQQAAAEPRYRIELLPTLGGRLNRPSGVNNRGWVAGFVNQPGNATRHAALWRQSVLTDLGTLGGPNSNVQWPGLSENGMVAGIAETGEPDTLGEAWSCTAFFPSVTGKICRGFVWEDDVMTPLPTLGGNQGFAAGVNNRGQVVGWAETAVEDPTCNDPQVLQFRAVMWEPKRGRTRQLSPLPGDSTSAATAINERGQVVGISGACDIAVGQRSARRSVLWEHDTIIDLGTLGGEFWHTPMDINDSGAVVGFSNPANIPGIAFAPRAFLWTRSGGIRALERLGDDTTSQAVGINDHGQVVGISGGPDGNRAFLWHDGVMRNLNDLVGDFPHRLLVAQHINDRGQIVGRAVLQGTTTQVPFVATPIEPPR